MSSKIKQLFVALFFFNLVYVFFCFSISLLDLLSSYYTEASEKITSLTNNKEELSKEYQKLFTENEFLLGKHIAKSEHLQAEIIDLPQKMEDMQFYCLKLREDLITALVAKERNEETFRSEILFLKGW